MGVIVLSDGTLAFWSNDKRIRTWDGFSDTVNEEYPIRELSELAPTLWTEYSRKTAKIKSKSWNTGIRSFLRYESIEQDIHWHGEGFWSGIHGTNQKMLATNDKNIAFLEVWRGAVLQDPRHLFVKKNRQ